jgi:CBS-domain-containing membrane protein
VKVSDLMATRVATCSPDDSLNRAAQIMWEQRCGSVPVVDQDRHVLGMITDRDVCMGAYTQGRRLDDIAVTAVMSRPVRICPGTATAEEAEGLMMAHSVHRLIVLDDAGRLGGVISLDDIARHGAAWDGKGGIDLERVGLALGEISRRTSTVEEDTPAKVDSDLSDVIQNSLEVLKTLRHEIRADLELASQDVRRHWAHLEARLHAAEIRARGESRGGARHLAELVEHARQFGSRLKRRNAGSLVH